MSVFWTRARHAELGDVVMPVAAVESYPGWEAVGEPSADDAALRAVIAREQAVDAQLAALAAEIGASPPAFPTPTPTASSPKTGADVPESSAPAGADLKE